MAGVYDNGKVGELLYYRNCGKVEGIPCCRFISSYPSFAEDDLIVAACHYVFGAHYPFFDGVCKTSFEENRLINSAELLQKLKILHIPCADLDDIHAFKHVYVCGAHYFRNYRQTCLFACALEQIKAFGFETLEGIGRGPGLECASSEEGRSCLLYPFGNIVYLLLRFN